MKKLFIYLIFLSIFPLTGACEDSLGVDKNVLITDKVINTGKQFIVVDSANFGFELERWDQITFDNNGNVWMCDKEEDLIKFDYKQKQKYDIRYIGFIRDIGADSKGNIWIAETKGLAKFRDGSIEFFDTANSELRYPYVKSIQIDKEDKIWINQDFLGYELPANELLVFDGNDSWSSIKLPADELSAEPSSINNMTFDSKNNLYIIKSGSKKPNNILYKYQNNQFSSFTSDNFPVVNGNIRSMSPYPNDKILVAYNWGIGTFNNVDSLRLAEINLINKDTYYYPSDFVGILSLALDEEGVLWFTKIDEEELFKYDGNSIEKFDIPPARPGTSSHVDPYIRRLALDRYGNILVYIEYAITIFGGYAIEDSFVYLFREDGVLLPEEAVSAIEERQQKNRKSIDLPQPLHSIFNFQFSKAGHVTLKVIDMLGNEVKTLVDGFKEAGSHEARLEAAGLPEGMYFYVLRMGERLESGKIVKID